MAIAYLPELAQELGQSLSLPAGWVLSHRKSTPGFTIIDENGFQVADIRLQPCSISGLLFDDQGGVVRLLWVEYCEPDLVGVLQQSLDQWVTACWKR